jgi:hypothetical protein
MIEAKNWGGPNYQQCLGAQTFYRKVTFQDRCEELTCQHHAEAAALRHPKPIRFSTGARNPSRQLEHMRRVTRITAPILLADIGDHCFGVFSLDLKSSDERIFGVHG